ncbi:hypothetical protein PR048_007634 [Dryococelus australis]|uniref:Cytochrome P450 n=1 Tax=Dryococelus australis TaxID=614101 RepID=A0ABQ9HUS2_9NEOP|nr:hypothetical protein PR048_007634 [Dryococelus australis]
MMSTLSRRYAMPRANITSVFKAWCCQAEVIPSKDIPICSWTPIGEDPGSICGSAILISVCRGFPQIAPVARALASHHGYPGSIPRWFAPGFSHVGIVLDNAACRRVFSTCPGMTDTNISLPETTCAEIMGVIFQSLGWDMAFIMACLILFASWYYTTAFSYWSSRGVHSMKPVVFFGNTKDKILMVRSFTDVQADIYRRTDGHKFVGFYDATTPVLMVKDLELIKNVLVRDFPCFMDRGLPSDTRNPINANLFALGGSKWRKLRSKLTPTFTLAKIKTMSKLMVECSEELVEWLEDINSSEDVVEVKEVAAKYTTDVIGSCVFGLQINAIKDPNCEFRVMGRNILEPGELALKHRIIITLFPFLGKLLASRKADINAFFLRIVKDVVSYREKNNVVRDDFIQLLIQLKKYGKVEDERNSKRLACSPPTNANRVQSPAGLLPNFRMWESCRMMPLVDGFSRKSPVSLTLSFQRCSILTSFAPIGSQDVLVRSQITDSLLAAQCFIFFVAGFETSSTTISCCLHELSLNVAIQDKLRREIYSVLRKHSYNLTYEAIQEMKYLEQVIDETLRKYPPSGFLARTCTKPYTIPNTNVHLEKGTVVIIPVRSIHHDPKYFPCPQRFDPERFSQENINKIPQFAYLPFGEGPRLCIGLRFGRMQVKVGLIALLKHYEFSVCEKTSVPIKFSFKIPLVDPPKEVWLKIKKMPPIREVLPKNDVHKRVKIIRETFQMSS